MCSWLRLHLPLRVVRRRAFRVPRWAAPFPARDSPGPLALLRPGFFLGILRDFNKLYKYLECNLNHGKSQRATNCVEFSSASLARALCRTGSRPPRRCSRSTRPRLPWTSAGGCSEQSFLRSTLPLAGQYENRFGESAFGVLSFFETDIELSGSLPPFG